MQGRRIAIITAICFLTAGCLQAQQMVTLEDAVAAALSHNYDILLAENDSAAAAIDKQYIYIGFLPTVNALVGRTQTISAQKQRYKDRPEVEGSGIKTTNLSAAINLNWVLFDGLKMFATRDKINELFDLGRLNLKNQVVNSVADVISAYYIIVRQKQQLKAIEEQMSINEERVKLADRKLSVGLGTKPELLQANGGDEQDQQQLDNESCQQHAPPGCGKHGMPCRRHRVVVRIKSNGIHAAHFP